MTSVLCVVFPSLLGCGPLEVFLRVPGAQRHYRRLYPRRRLLVSQSPYMSLGRRFRLLVRLLSGEFWLSASFCSTSWSASWLSLSCSGTGSWAESAAVPAWFDGALVVAVALLVSGTTSLPAPVELFCGGRLLLVSRAACFVAAPPR